MPNRRLELARIAEDLARKPLRGNLRKAGRDLAPLLGHFPRKDECEGFDWCAAFVYHCCVTAGFRIPVKWPEPVPYTFAAVPAWLVWAKLPGHRLYFSARNPSRSPQRGDLVIFDNLLGNGPHDHMGVVLHAAKGGIRTAEGNVENMSGIFERRVDRKVRGFIRIPHDFSPCP